MRALPVSLDEDINAVPTPTLNKLNVDSAVTELQPCIIT
jgi:hypothetical protein